MSAEDEVLGGLALSGIGIDVRTYEAGRLSGDQCLTVSRFSCGLIAGGAVCDHGSSGFRVGDARWIHRPYVLAEFCGDYEFRDIRAAEQDLASKRDQALSPLYHIRLYRTRVEMA